MVTAIIIILSVLLFISVLILFLIAPSRGAKEMRKVFMHRNLAHRGLHTKDKSTPENSLSAFKAAVEAGYGIEFDLQLSKDEQVVVFHDDTLNRVCGIDNRVDFYTFDELQEFSLCGTSEKIPLFTEVLKTVDGRVPLLIELKNGPRNDLLCKKAYEIMKQYSGEFCIESFSPIIVSWFRKNAPEIMRGQLACSIKEYGNEVSKPIAFLLSNLMLNFLARPHFVAYHIEKRSPLAKLCDRLGAMRFVWTVRPTCDIEKLCQKNDSLIFELYKPDIRY